MFDFLFQMVLVARITMGRPELSTKTKPDITNQQNQKLNKKNSQFVQMFEKITVNDAKSSHIFRKITIWNLFQIKLPLRNLKKKNGLLRAHPF